MQRWMLILAGLLYLGAAYGYARERKYELAIAFIAYAVANFMFARL